MVGFGVAFIFAAILIFAFKIAVALSPEGGAPVLDGIVFPPLMITYGFVLIGFARRIGTGDWVYWALWLALTLLAVGAILYASKVAERRIKKYNSDHTE